MQKISDKDLQSVSTRKIINSSKILNVIDEAHHGQTKETTTDGGMNSATHSNVAQLVRARHS